MTLCFKAGLGGTHFLFGLQQKSNSKHTSSSNSQHTLLEQRGLVVSAMLERKGGVGRGGGEEIQFLI